MLAIEREHGAVLLHQKYQLALGVRRALGDRLGPAWHGPFFIGLIQSKLGTLDCLAVLVDLLDLGRRQGGKVELERHVRCARAALQIEEAQRVLGAVAEGAAGEVGGIRTGSFEHLLDGRVLNCLFGVICVVDMADMHRARSKVDLERRLLVNAAQVTHEHTVDIHPDIIVAREFKDHVLVFGGLAACRLDKLRGHGHAKVVVEIRASVNDLFRGEVVAVLIKNLACRVKGEELAQIGFFARIALIYARFIVDVKGIGRGVIHSVVAVRTVRAVRVVDVVTILELEEAFHVVVDGFAVLPTICLAGVVKEISQRLIGVRTTRVIGGVGTGINRWITIYQRVLHKRKASIAIDGAFARPPVNARAGATIELELMVFIDTGVVILVVVVYVLRAIVIAIDNPVVEQVDRGAGRIHRLHGVVTHGSRRTRRTKQESARRQRNGQNP